MTSLKVAANETGPTCGEIKNVTGANCNARTPQSTENRSFAKHQKLTFHKLFRIQVLRKFVYTSHSYAKTVISADTFACPAKP